MDVQRVTFQRSFAVDNLSGPQSYTAQLHCTFCHGIQMIDQCSAEAIQHFMYGNEVSAAHVPVRLFGNQRKINKLDNLAIQQLYCCFFLAVGDIVAGIKQIGRF